MQKKKIKKPITPLKQVKTPVIKTKIEYPSNKNIYFYSALALTFIVSLVLYIKTLAPALSFEDSGEFITAAFTLGVPHEPGYPLFSMIGKLFTIIIPFGNIAFRVNLLSSVFSALAATLITYITVILIEDVFINSKFWKNNDEKFLNIFKYTLALSAGLFFGVSFENWEQAIMTEVYGLHSFFTALFILLSLIWRRQDNIKLREKYLYLIAFIIALSQTNHNLSLMFIPIFGVFLLVVDYKMLLNFKIVLKSIVFFVIGLIPYLYLPFAASSKPPMNWGNPSNWTNFIRVIMRHQYQGDNPQTAKTFIPELKYYISQLLPEQWFPIYLIFGFVGLFVVYRYYRKFFYFSLVFLLFAYPITTYMTNSEVTGDPDIVANNGQLVSVAYISSYMFLSIMIGLGMFYLISLIKTKRYIYIVLAGICVLFALSNVPKNYKELDMSTYSYPEKYVENVFKVATKNSIVIGDWDPYCFPFFYYQYVEKKRQDIIALDINLLKRTWYLQMLTNNHPDFIKRSQAEVNKFLEAVEPFENGTTYNGEHIQECYENMIHSFIEKNLLENKDVYITYINPQTQQILKKYPRESVFIAYKIPRESSLTKVDFKDLDLDIFINDKHPKDRIVKKFKLYYGELAAARANLYQNIGNKSEALKCYNLSLPFLKYENNAQIAIYQRIQQINSDVNNQMQQKNIAN